MTMFVCVGKDLIFAVHVLQRINIILRKLQLMLNSNISLGWMIFENFNWIASSWFFTNISTKRKEIIKIHFWRTLYIVPNVHYCQCYRYDIWRILGIWNIYLEKQYNNVRKYIDILRCNLIFSSVTLRSFLVQNSCPVCLENSLTPVQMFLLESSLCCFSTFLEFIYHYKADIY